MKYNFDEIIERRNTNSVKWDNPDPEMIPMWVADMDFKICPEIQNALLKRVSEGIFGYEYLSSEFINSVKDWMLNRHQFIVEEKNILPAPGVLLSISAIVRTYLKKGDNLIIQPPVYNHFFDLARNCDINIISNPLIYNDAEFDIDFEDLEDKASDPKTKMLILCNPHNPIGKVWEIHQLQRIAEICSKNNIIVVSDEIHADIVFKGHNHVPFAKAVKGFELVSFSCGSPCKAFNLASLSVSYIISENVLALNNVKNTFQMQETEWLNPLSSTALITAYKSGEEWLTQLIEYVFSNYLYLKDFIENNIPQIKVATLESTYLVWLDCSSFRINSEELAELISQRSKLRLNPGSIYGETREGFLRLNIGCPREILMQGLQRLSEFFNQDSALQESILI